MKKAALAALVLVPFALAYALWPSPPDPAAPAAGVAAAPDAVTARAPLPRDERHAIAPVPTVTPAPPPAELAIRWADGTPAPGLPVWFFRDDASRPAWTHPVDARREREVAPGAANADADAPLPPPHATTDARGLLRLPADAATGAAAVLAVGYAPAQWFAARRAADGEPFVLPAFGDVEVGVRNAPAGTAWSALVTAAVLEDDGGQSLYGALRTNVDAPGGRGVVRIGEHRYEVRDGDRLHVRLPRGQPACVELDAHGFALQVVRAPGQLGQPGDERQAIVRAPAVVEAECTGRLRGVAVVVRERDGGLAHLGGRCSLQRRRGGPDEPDATEQRTDLANGAATFDQVALHDGATYDLTVLLDDGEWFRRAVQFAVAGDGPRVELVRGTGAPPLHVRLGDAAGGDGDVRGVAIEAADGSIGGAESWPDFYTATLPVWRVRDGAVELSLVGTGWRRLWILREDARTGIVDAADVQDGTADLRWLPSSATPDVDLAALYRAHGDHAMSAASLQVELAGSAGRRCWFTVANHRRFRHAERTPPPVWRSLRLPDALPARLQLYVSDEPDGSGGTTIELPVAR